MAPHSSTLAWKIPWVEEPGRLQSMGSLGVGHDWATSLSLFTFMHWRKWQPTPVFLPGESQERGAWWAAVYGVAQSQTWLKRLSSSRISNTVWSHNGQSEHPCLVPDLSGDFQLSSVEYDLSYEFVIYGPYYVDVCSLCAHFRQTFYLKGNWILSKPLLHLLRWSYGYYSSTKKFSYSLFVCVLVDTPGVCIAACGWLGLSMLPKLFHTISWLGNIL